MWSARQGVRTWTASKVVWRMALRDTETLRFQPRVVSCQIGTTRLERAFHGIQTNGSGLCHIIQVSQARLFGWSLVMRFESQNVSRKNMLTVS